MLLTLMTNNLGVVGSQKEEIGSATGTSSMSGTISRVRNEAGSSTGTSTISGTIARTRNESASSTGTSSASGTILRTRNESGSSTGTSTASGTILRKRNESSTVTGTSSVTGSISRKIENYGYVNNVLVGDSTAGEPSFTSSASGWDAAFADSTVARSTSVYHSSPAALLVTGSGAYLSTNTTLVARSFVADVLPDTWYTLSAWVYIPSGSPGTEAYLQAFVYDYGPGTQYGATLEASVSAAPNTWTQVFLDYLTPSFVPDDGLTFYVGGQSSSGGFQSTNLYVDDVVLAKNTSAMEGAISTIINLSGTAHGTSKMTGKFPIEYSGSIVGTSSMRVNSEYVVGGFPLPENEAVITATGMFEERLVSATASGTSTAQGAISADRLITGSSHGTSSVTAVVGRVINLSGTATGTSSMAGTASRISTVAGTSVGISNANGTISLTANLSGAIVGSSTVSGAINRYMLVGGTSAGTSEATGFPTKSHVGDLSADAYGTSSMTGSISVDRFMTGNIVGTSSVSGTAGKIYNNSGHANGFSSINGNISRISRVGGSIVGSSSVTGSASMTISYSATANGISIVIGDIVRRSNLSGSIVGYSSIIGEITRIALATHFIEYPSASVVTDDYGISTDSYPDVSVDTHDYKAVRP